MKASLSLSFFLPTFIQLPKLFPNPSEYIQILGVHDKKGAFIVFSSFVFSKKKYKVMIQVPYNKNKQFL